MWVKLLFTLSINPWTTCLTRAAWPSCRIYDQAMCIISRKSTFSSAFLESFKICFLFCYTLNFPDSFDSNWKGSFEWENFFSFSQRKLPLLPPLISWIVIHELLHSSRPARSGTEIVIVVVQWATKWCGISCSFDIWGGRRRGGGCKEPFRNLPDDYYNNMHSYPWIAL